MQHRNIICTHPTLHKSSQMFKQHAYSYLYWELFRRTGNGGRTHCCGLTSSKCSETPWAWTIEFVCVILKVRALLYLCKTKLKPTETVYQLKVTVTTEYIFECYADHDIVCKCSLCFYIWLLKTCHLMMIEWLEVEVETFTVTDVFSWTASECI